MKIIYNIALVIIIIQVVKHIVLYVKKATMQLKININVLNILILIVKNTDIYMIIVLDAINAFPVIYLTRTIIVNWLLL